MNAERLRAIGDELREELEAVLTDPVVNEYLREKDWMLNPNIHAVKWEENPSLRMLDEWDEAVGELQREGIVGPFLSGDETIVEAVDANV